MFFSFIVPRQSRTSSNKKEKPGRVRSVDIETTLMIFSAINGCMVKQSRPGLISAPSVYELHVLSYIRWRAANWDATRRSALRLQSEVSWVDFWSQDDNFKSKDSSAEFSLDSCTLIAGNSSGRSLSHLRTSPQDMSMIYSSIWHDHRLVNPWEVSD
jgi:hypothetical protein